MIILSGGNDIAILNEEGKNIWKERDMTENILWEYCIENKIPILGICRGCQFIANKIGMEIYQIENHINKIHTVKNVINNMTIKVNSYHSWGIKLEKKKKNYKILYTSPKDNTIEAFYDDSFVKALCIMWHPERESGAYKEVIEMIRKYLY